MKTKGHRRQDKEKWSCRSVLKNSEEGKSMANLQTYQEMVLHALRKETAFMNEESHF